MEGGDEPRGLAEPGCPPATLDSLEEAGAGPTSMWPLLGSTSKGLSAAFGPESLRFCDAGLVDLLGRMGLLVACLGVGFGVLPL